MIRTKYLVYLGASHKDGKLNKPYWHPIVSWLANHSTSITLSGFGGLVRMIQRFGGLVMASELPSPAPDMDVHVFNVVGNSEAMRQVVESLYYTADGDVEYLAFAGDTKVLATLHIEDENILVLYLAPTEMQDLISSVGDLSENVSQCRQHAPEFVGLLVGESEDWRPLGEGVERARGTG